MTLPWITSKFIIRLTLVDIMLTPCPSIEMRHSVTTLIYLIRKVLDNVLYSISSPRPVPLSSLVPLLSRMPFRTMDPGGWLPLYTMVTFRPDVSYATARHKATHQASILTRLRYAGLVLLGAAGTSSIFSFLLRRIELNRQVMERCA